MDQWPRTKLGKFAYDSLTIVVAAIGLYLTVGTIVAGLTVLIGVQYLVFRALFGKPERM